MNTCPACGRAVPTYGLCEPCSTLNTVPPWPQGHVVVRDYPSLDVVEEWEGTQRKKTGGKS